MIVIVLVLAMNNISLAGDGGPQDLPFVYPEVKSQTNIHFDADHCLECHLQEPVSKDTPLLRFSDYLQTCRCHGYTADSYTHPLGSGSSPDMQKDLPEDLPLENGKITCNTCHLIAGQCSADKNAKKYNPNFLRADPYQPRTTFCYQCHDKSRYKRLNPHEQLDADGNIIESKCLYCHKFKPDEENATLEKQRRGEKGSVEFIAEFFRLCFRCHFRQTRGHLINANHLTRNPPEKILSNMVLSEKNMNVILPLDDEGGLTCATCHNPHQKGVIPSESPGAKGASEEQRLRVPMEGNRICRACHSSK